MRFKEQMALQHLAYRQNFIEKCENKLINILHKKFHNKITVFLDRLVILIPINENFQFKIDMVYGQRTNIVISSYVNE